MTTILSTSHFAKLASFAWWGGLYLFSLRAYPNKCPEFHSRVVTLLHGSVAAVAGLSQCNVLEFSLSNLTSECTTYNYVLMLWSWGYFAFDLLWCLVTWSETALMIGHHACAVISITIYMQKPNTGCTFACCLAMMEITNPCLQMRWFLKSEGYQNTRLYRIIELSYIFLFVLVRGVFGTYALYKILPCNDFQKDEKIICLVFYIVSVGFMIDIFGFVRHKYKNSIGKFQEVLDRYGIILNE